MTTVTTKGVVENFGIGMAPQPTQLGVICFRSDPRGSIVIPIAGYLLCFAKNQLEQLLRLIDEVLNDTRAGPTLVSSSLVHLCAVFCFFLAIHFVHLFSLLPLLCRVTL